MLVQCDTVSYSNIKFRRQNSRSFSMHITKVVGATSSEGFLVFTSFSFWQTSLQTSVSKHHAISVSLTHWHWLFLQTVTAFAINGSQRYTGALVLILRIWKQGHPWAVCRHPQTRKFMYITSLRGQSRDEPWPQTTCIEKLTKFGIWFLRYARWQSTDGRQTCLYITLIAAVCLLTRTEAM